MVALLYLKVWHVGNSFEFICSTVLLSNTNQFFHLSFIGFNKEYSNPQRTALPVLRTDVMFSVCVPSSCTAQDVKAHMDVSLNSVNASAILYNTSCSSADPEPLVIADYLTM